MGMLDDEDFGRLEQLLGDDEGAEGVAGAAAGVADDMGVAGGDAEGGVGVDAAVHAGYYGGGGYIVSFVFLGGWGERGGGGGGGGDLLPSAYFLAGRWDKSPSSKHLAYFRLLRMRCASFVVVILILDIFFLCTVGMVLIDCWF